MENYLLEFQGGTPKVEEKTWISRCKILMDARASSKKNDSFYHINICHNKFCSHLSFHAPPVIVIQNKNFYCRHEPSHKTFFKLHH